MKVRLEIELDLPLGDATATGDARSLIEQEVCDHVLGDAARYQLKMLMMLARKGVADSTVPLSSREFWHDVLSKGTVRMID